MDTSAGPRISEVAAQTGFSASALRYYEGAGLVEPARTPSGYRVYDDRTIERLRFVARGKDLGLSLEEIAELLPAWDRDDCGKVASPLAARVAAKVEETRDRIAELTGLAEELEVAHRRLTHDVTTGPCGPSCTCTPRPAAVDTRVQLVLGTKPAASPAGPAPIACTLTAGAAVDRVGDWNQFLAEQSGAPVRQVGDATGSVTVRFPPDPRLTRRAAELASAEQACCAFIAFTLRIDRTGTELPATTPLDGLPVIDALLGATP
ncbi:MAG: MerR family transcriptional regulator [Acidimicrobiales bacterium]